MATLTCPDAPSATGAFQLSWQGQAGARYTVEETDPAGTHAVVYRGTDVATTLSGRHRGSYQYALSVGDDTVAATCSVDVRPPSWTLVAALFTAGLIVTLSTIVLVVRGHRAHRRGHLS